MTMNPLSPATVLSRRAWKMRWSMATWLDLKSHDAKTRLAMATRCIDDRILHAVGMLDWSQAELACVDRKWWKLHMSVLSSNFLDKPEESAADRSIWYARQCKRAREDANWQKISRRILRLLLKWVQYVRSCSSQFPGWQKLIGWQVNFLQRRDGLHPFAVCYETTSQETTPSEWLANWNEVSTQRN